METQYPSLFNSNLSWFSASTEWTKEENKKFESALAIYSEHDPERWRKVAAMIPGKTVYDVIKQYRELEEDVGDIESGRVPIPGYLTSSFTLELVESSDFDVYRKRQLTSKRVDQGRKRGAPWTEEEHRRFLMGLLKHGKGDWRNISRNFVVSKTPTQVASHAQKYFIRQQLSGSKDKRRPSIHDITTVNPRETTSQSHGNKLGVLNQFNVILPQQNPINMQNVLISRHHSNDGSILILDSGQDNLCVSSPSNSPKLQGQNVYASVHCGVSVKPHNFISQMQYRTVDKRGTIFVPCHVSNF